jgi:hypothetical protein
MRARWPYIFSWIVTGEVIFFTAPRKAGQRLLAHFAIVSPWFASALGVCSAQKFGQRSPAEQFRELGAVFQVLQPARLTNCVAT